MFRVTSGSGPSNFSQEILDIAQNLQTCCTLDNEESPWKELFYAMHLPILVQTIRILSQGCIGTNKRIRFFTKEILIFFFLSHRKVQMLEWIFVLMSTSIGLQSIQEGKVRTQFRFPDPEYLNSFIGTFTDISLQSAEKCGEQQVPRLSASVKYPLPETDPKHR